MKNKKPVFMLTVMLMGILTQFMTSVSTIQAFAATGESIIEKPSAYLLEKDKYGNPTIFTSVKMVVKDKDGNNEDITESRPLKVGEAFNIEYVFRIPDQLGKEVEAGDYFEFDLPDSEDIQLTSVQTGPLVDPDNGAIYGDFIAEKNGHVLMTFNENVKTHDDVDGKLAFTVKFEEKTIHIPGGYEIDFPYVVDGGDTIIYVKGEHDSYIQKEYLGNEGFTYRWKALINPKYQKMRQLELWEETKEIGGGTAIAESINIEKMVKADVKLNGDVFEHDDEVSLKNKTFDSNGNIDLGFDSIDEPYVIYLNTPFEFGISNTVRNTIRLKATIDGQDIGESASAETNSGSHSIIDKKVEHYDRDNQTISWLVTYNPGGFHIKEEDAYFHDEITNGTLVDNSMTVEPSLKHRVDVATNKQSFDFQFETDVKEPVHIRYETKVIDTTPIPNPPNAPIKNSVKNKVIAKEQEKEVIQPVTPGGDGEDGEGGEGGGDETSSIIKKVREADQNGAIWTLHINPENKSLDRWWITDRVDSGSIRQSTLNVKNKYTGATVPPSEYELDWHKNEKGEAVGFTLEYNHKTSDDFEITYQTNVDRNTTQRNKAVYHYTIKGSEKEDEASTSYDPIQVGEIGLSKSGRYIPESKEIEWTILINNSTKVPVAPNNLLRDPILDNQTFVEGSVKYDFMDGAWQSHYKPEITFNEEENQLEVRKLKEANNKQRIIFRTQLKDKMEILEQPIYNTAYYSDDYTDEKEATASLTIDNANDYVLRKQGKQNEQNDKLIDWTIDINPYGHKLDNLVIYDESWENQKVIKETIEIKDAFTQTPLLEGVDYDLEYTERSFTIRMRDRVDQHLILTYQGFLFFPDGTALGSDQTVSNSVRITADRVIKTDKPITKTVKVKVSESSGIIEGKVRDLNVIKVSEEDNSRVLPGAEFTLYRGTEKDESKIVDKQVTTHEGEALFTRLTKGDYLLVETKAPEGYDISSEMANGRVITVTTEETTTIEELVSNPKVGSEKFVEFPVKKKWKNVPNYMETPEITVWLLANGDRKESMVLNEANHYQGTFRQLPEKENGTTIDYSIEEVAVEGYESHISGGTITNTFITETTHLTGKKIWRNDEASDRPEKVEIQLLQDGNDFGDSITVTKDDSWEYEFNDLPKVNDQTGIDYEYSVKELNVSDNYESIVEGTDVINTKIDEPVDFEKIDIKGQKKWVGDNEYLRPESITIELKQNGDYYDHQIITADDSWAYEFNDLDKQDEFGNDYTYTVEEKNVPSSYDVSYSEFDITNTYKKEELVSVSGEKKWIGDNNEVRPDSIHVRLIKNSEETELTQEVKGPNWTYSFTELPKYQENSSEENVYTVKEENVPDGYVSEVDAENNIINTWTEEPLVNIPVVKLWDDSQNVFDTRPDYIYVFLYRVNYENVENPILVDEADISGDAHADEWEYVFEDLPKFDEKGRENHYYVKEILMSDSLYEQTSMGTTITNTLPKLKTEIKGKKTWKKDTEYDRPDEITVELYGTDKNKVLQSVTTSARNDWEYEFVDLDKYDDQNNEIDYTVKEVNVPGYESEVDSNNNITNTKKEPDKTTISGEKRWENDTEGVRPEKIEVTLLQNSAVKETITVTPDKVEGTTITNTYENKDTVDVSGEKIWIDYNDKFETRPETITVKLLQNNKEYKEQEVSEGSDKRWKYAFNDLPKYDSDHKEYDYTIKEVPVENYTTKIKGHTIENTYVNDKRIKFSGKKTWEDYDDKFDTRPDEVTIYLLRGNEKIEETTAKKETGWTYSFTNEGKGYPVYDDEGEVIDYRVLEKDVQGYETTITKPTESIEDVAEITGYDIKNTYVNTEKTQLSGSKEWDDFDNKYDSRPEKIKVTLYKGSEKTDMTQEMSEETGWTYVFKELPVYDKDGNTIEYSVKEEVVKDYEEVQGEPNFINKWIHKDDTTFIEGIKDWNDEQNKLGKRPNEVTIILYQNGQPTLDENDQIMTQEVSVTTFWKYRFDNLPKYDENGDEFVYSVKEEQVPGYVTEIVNNDVVNTYNNSKTTWVSGKKVWNDQGNKVNSRPESITVELYQNEGKKPYKTKVVKPDIRGNWNYLFTNLPKYDEHLNEYQYTVKEVNVPHYDSTVNGFIIENTYKNDEVTEISGDKEWLDQNNKLNTRPDSIDVELYQNENEKPFKTETFKADENGNWSYAFTNLPKYDENLDEYHYSVKEVPVKDYDSEVLDKHTIVNTYQNKSMVNVQGDKIWDDHQDILHSRPESIVVNLHRNNKLIPIKYQKVMSDENGQWHYEFNELPKYDKNLNEYDYKVKEMKVPHYNSQVEIDPITGQMNITNTYDNTDLTEVTGQKIWKNDVNDKLNTRPESIRLDLYQIDPSNASREEIFVASQTVTPDAEGDWFYSFEDLPKFNDELIAYEYVVKEQPVEHYETTVDGTTVTNTYQNLTLIDLSGVKLWDDENNKLETRPNELFIELYQTTKEAPEVIEGQSPYRITKVEANHEGNWFYEFKDLPKYDDNLDDYVYTIREQEVIDYDNTINGMNVHNKYRNEELTQVTGKKIWVDFDNKLNTRPKSIEVELYQNGQLMHGKTQIVEPDTKGDWSYEFKELPKYDDKLEKYQYTVKEKEVAHYTSEVIDHNIVNTYENTELTQLTGKKIWIDEKNKLDTRPESITVELYQNGNLMPDKTQIVKPNKLGQWSYEFKELPKYDSELNLYDYTVKEQTVPHYTSEVTDQGITNTYNNTDVTQVIGKKTWVDHDNKLKTRPKEIKVDLYQNDKLMEEKTQTVKPTKEGDWSYEFTDLPKYDKELNEYRYSVKEQPVSDYTSSVDGFDITNTYQNKEVVKRHVKKKWVDEDNKIESRPEKIKVNLYQNQGKKPYKTKIIKPDAEGNWEHTFENLPKYDDNYDEYTYTVEEEAVAHYKGKVEISEGNVVITNTYNNTDVVTVNGEKQWNDLDDKLGKRPEKIIVDLYQNKAKEPFATQEVTPDKEGNWSYEFKDLPKYDKELNEYDYTVKEHQVADYDTYVEGTTIVNTYKNVETTKVKGKKKWDDFGNKLSSRPESIKVDLYQNGGDKPFRTQEVTPNKFGNWKYTFNNLPKHDKDLNEYTYTVKEQPVSHYESHVEGTTITNTYQNTDITQVEGVKTWDDENDKLGKRPDFILVELYQLAPNDNVIQADQKPFKIQKVEADETGAWSYVFEDLPKYDERLNEFNYVVQEHQVVDYQGEVTDNNIHNTYQNTEKTNIKGEKIWVDEDDKYHTRPKSIQIELYQNGELLKDHTQKIKADKEGDWSYEFTDLPKYDDELTEYTYTVNEVPVKGYTTSVQGTTITNTLEKDPTDPDKPESGKPGPNTPGNPSTTGKGQFLPKTGEEVTTHFMTSLIGLAVITLVGFLGYRRREQ